ncbi:MAG: IS91 family transposase [Ardenticatenia bacterium]|nr:IS91 family transposase [Ardenticatenia bacterium]
MNATAIELADIVRDYGEAYLARYQATSWHQRRVLLGIARCRTAAMGGHVEVCAACGLVRNAYNSCRNRHCAKCLGSARERWAQAREAELLPVPYFHVVFTLPPEIAALALGNAKVVYDALFRAAAGALTTVASDPKHLGARIGFVAVLHTWGQKLDHHPHVHCLVPGGGLSPEGERWIPALPDFFLPVRVLSRVFRGKCLDLLTRAARDGQLHQAGGTRVLTRRLARSRRHEWVVYAKPPFGGPVQVVRYLARYTHRVAIANRRIVGLADGNVTFRYKDYADGNEGKTLTLPVMAFLRRFLTHVLPASFIRIRHYGLMANHGRVQHLLQCRAALAGVTTDLASPVDLPVQQPPELEPDRALDPFERERCPVCHTGLMTLIRHYARPFLAPTIPPVPQLAWNTS